MLNGYETLLDTVLERLSTKIQKQSLICDHICYRVESKERYQELKKELSLSCRLATESLVSGRMISIFELPSPLVYKNLSIDCIELPAPKKGSPYKEGWEHAEFVIEDLHAFINDHSELDFNHKAMDRKINPELGLKITDEFQVKFHPMHILEVIEIESNL
jgi:uncharacterized protein